MRLIAWNANFARHPKRSFEQNANLLFEEGADVVVLSETARPAESSTDRIAWVGRGNPGLGVMVRAGFSLSASDLNAQAPDLFAAYEVSGPVSFGLLAAWPVNYSRQQSYAKSLEAGLDRFGDFLMAERVVFTGDLNSSTRVSGQTRSHPALVARARGMKLESVYHHQNQEEHGSETIATYRHGGPGKGHFHIDYCFLSPALLTNAKVKVLNNTVWDKRSDHYPVVVDLE
jgi:endonuclease/exonuclease/phosphatase (EEP) superfamily protein YafD